MTLGLKPSSTSTIMKDEFGMKGFRNV